MCKSNDDQQYEALFQHIFSRIVGMEFLCLDTCPIQNLGDALTVLSSFSQDPDLTRDRAAYLVVASFSPNPGPAPAMPTTHSDTTWRCVELVANLWSNVDIRVPKGVSRGFSSPCVWSGDKTLQDFLRDEFENKRRHSSQDIVYHHETKMLERCTMA